jgi:hypothetical protein
MDSNFRFRAKMGGSDITSAHVPRQAGADQTEAFFPVSKPRIAVITATQAEVVRDQRGRSACDLRLHVDARDKAPSAAYRRDGDHPAVQSKQAVRHPERADEVEANLRRIIDAIKDGSFQRLIDAEDTLQIQQGHFNLPITDSGIVLLKKMNRWVRLKIPLLFADVDIATIIDDVLAKGFPKVNG